MSSSQRHVTISLLALTLALAAPNARASEAVTYGPAGDWVKPLGLTPGDTKPRTFLLRDVQLNLGDTVTTTYNEIALLAGENRYDFNLPAIEWDPATESIVVHKAVVIRGGQTIDLGPDPFAPPPIPVPPVPAPWGNPALSAHTTASLRLATGGIKPGDIVDLAWSVIHHDPALAGHVDAVVSETLSLPTARLHVRAVWPSAEAVHWQGAAVYSGDQATQADGRSEWTLDRTDVPEISSVTSSAQGLRSPRLVFTTFADWSDVAATLAPAFSIAARLKPNTPLQAEVARLRAISPDPKVQIAEALRLVQETMRVTPPQVAALTSSPEDADTLWNNRWGDAKSLTVVLTAVLRDLGLDAAPALTSTRFGHALNSLAPDIYAFDKPLVRVVIAGKTYWLDPAVASDHRLDNRPPLSGWGLALVPKATLQDLTPPLPEQPTEDTTVHIDASAGLDIPAPTHIERVYRTDTNLSTPYADGQLPVEVDRSIRTLFQGEYPNFDAQRTSRHYDPQTGELRLSADGVTRLNWQPATPLPTRQLRIDAAAIGGKSALDYCDVIVVTDAATGSVSLRAAATDSAQAGAYDRLTADIPVTRAYPAWTHVNETIVLPYGGKGFALKGDGAVDTTLIGVHYRRTTTLKEATVSIDTSAETMAPDVPRPQAVADTPKLQQLAKVAVEVIAPANYVQTPADKAAADAARPATAAGFVVRGQAYLRGGETGAALADFDAALGLRPGMAPAHVARGYVRNRLKDSAGAEADFTAAQALDPHNAAAFAGEGVVLAGHKDYDGAIAAFTRAIDLQPQAADVHLERARAYFLNKDYVAARADAEAELRIAPYRPIPATIALIDIDDAEGKTADAVALARGLVERYPDDDTAHVELGLALGCLAPGMVACTADRPAAFAEFTRAIALHPSAFAYASRSAARPLKDTAGRHADLDAGLAIDPNDNFALMTRSALYLYEKDYVKGLADADAVLAKTPNDPQALNLRAVLLGQLKRYDEQMAVFKAELKLDPGNAGALNGLCWSRATRNIELDQALDNCNAAIRLSPLPGYYDSRALVELRLGKLDDAQADYDTALTKRPDLAGSLYGRGLVKMRKGQVEDGKADIAKALAINPNVAGDFQEMGLTPDRP